MTCLAPIVLLATYQVPTRFIFRRPSAFSEVATRACLIWKVLLGCDATFRKGAMIAVDLAFDLASPTLRRAGGSGCAVLADRLFNVDIDKAEVIEQSAI